MTNLKCTGLSVHVQTHLTMIKINSQKIVGKSALETAETVITVGCEASVQPSPVWKTSSVAARLESSRLRLS